MHIAYILPSLANKGPIIATRDIIQSLNDYEKDLSIVVYYFDDIVEIDMGVPTHQISFWQYIDFSSYDVIHSCNIRPDIYLWLQANIKQKKIKNKIVTTMHNIMHDELKFTYGNFISKIASFIWLSVVRSFNKVIVSSEQMKIYYQHYLNQDRLTVIPYGRAKLIDNSVPTEDSEKILELKKQYKIIGTISTLTKRKNVAQVIRFLENNIDYALVSLGSGEEYDKLIKLAKELKVEHRVMFLGTRPDSRKYYQFLDIFCLPSFSEGFGLVVIDAMAYKVPIVLSNLDVYKDILTNTEVAFFELNNEQSFQEAVNYAMENNEKLINSAFYVYENNFSMKVYAKKHTEVYNLIMHNKCSAK